jgi:hypothetical protein
VWGGGAPLINNINDKIEKLEQHHNLVSKFSTEMGTETHLFIHLVASVCKKVQTKKKLSCRKNQSILLLCFYTALKPEP